MTTNKLSLVLEAESAQAMQRMLQDLATSSSGEGANAEKGGLALYSDDELLTELAKREKDADRAAVYRTFMSTAESPQEPPETTEPTTAKRGRGRPRKNAAPPQDPPAGRQISDNPEDRNGGEAEAVTAEDELDELLQTPEAQPEPAKARTVTHDDIRAAVRKCQAKHGAEVARQRLVAHKVTAISAIPAADLPKIEKALLEGVDG